MWLTGWSAIRASTVRRDQFPQKQDQERNTEDQNQHIGSGRSVLHHSVQLLREDEAAQDIGPCPKRRTARIIGHIRDARRPSYPRHWRTYSVQSNFAIKRTVSPLLAKLFLPCGCNGSGPVQGRRAIATHACRSCGQLQTRLGPPKRIQEQRPTQLP
jgi:hypothetical protein